MERHGILTLMSTAELKEIIDQRTPEERKWMTAYLLDEMFSVPELRQTAEELSELAQRRADLLAGRSRVSEAEAEQYWSKQESRGE
jgi:hypothetical protein